MDPWIVLKLIGLVGLTLALTSGCGPSYDITEFAIPVDLGDRQVEVVVHEAEAPGLTYLNMHDNEDTAADAALDVIRRNGGRLVELQHTGERNVAFSLGDSAYAFDPNRMFTPGGLEATLREHGAYSEEAQRAVTALADTMLQAAAIDELAVVITVHNNSEGEYSTLSYVGDGQYQSDALFAHYDNTSDPDDFFYVTNEQLYSHLRDAGFNVVLQDNAKVTDDGSLSVYAGRRGIPYINVEAQHGHFDEQVKMIDYLTAYLPEINLNAPPTE